MIAGELTELRKQANINYGLEQAFLYLSEINPESLVDGKVSINGDKVFAIISHYDTSKICEEIEVEGHRRYVDLQYIAAGSEAIGWIGIDQIKESRNYDTELDVWKCNLPVCSISLLKLASGQAALLFPEDAHCSQLCSSTPEKVVKIVIKVSIDFFVFDAP